MKDEKKNEKKIIKVSFDLNKMEELVDRLVDTLVEKQNTELGQKEPIIMGLALKIDPDGKPILREFGNAKKIEKKEIKPIKKQKIIQPLIDVFSNQEQVIITAQLPGVKGKDISCTINETKVTINAKTFGKKYYKEILLNNLVEPKPIKAQFKNSILELTLNKIK